MTIKRIHLCVVLVIGLIGISYKTAASQSIKNCLPYEPATITVAGKTENASGYGPPGFGEDPEHDLKESYVLLTTDKPFCVSGGKENSYDTDIASIQKMQMVFPKGQRFDNQLIGQPISVTGQLFHRVSGGHTDVMIMVDRVEKPY